MKILNKQMLIRISAVVLFIVAVVYCVKVFSKDPSPGVKSYDSLDDTKRTKYVVLADSCKTLFTVTAQEFREYALLFDEKCVSIRENAKVDSNGNLVLSLTKKEEAILSDYYKGNYDEFSKLPQVTVSDDYYSLTIKGTKKEINDILEHKLNFWVFNHLAIMQLLNGKSGKTIKVKYTLIDSKTDEILYTVVFPDQNIKLIFNFEEDN